MSLVFPWMERPGKCCLCPEGLDNPAFPRITTEMILPLLEPMDNSMAVSAVKGGHDIATVVPNGDVLNGLPR